MERLSLAACLVTLACALTLPAVAQAETVTSTTTKDVIVIDNDVAGPYPASLQLDGANGVATDVNVTLTISHFRPNDMDVMVVSPGGDAVRLMIDACGDADMNDTAITFDDAAPSQLPANNCVSGTYRPTAPGSATFPAPAPAASGLELSAFNAENPNGDWQLYVVDDEFIGSGTITSWGVTVTTEPAEITIPADGTFNTEGVASAYPLTQSVATPDGEVIADVDLLMSDLNHSHPADLDILLEGPGVQPVMLMSDACGSGDMISRQIRFSDEGSQLSEGPSTQCSLDPLVGPADFGEFRDGLPAPAPKRPFASTLSVFDGLDVDEWRLWINDDAGGDTGFLDGWEPVLTTRPAAATGFTATEISTAEGETASLTVTRSGPVGLGPATLDVTVSHEGADATDYGEVPVQLQFARGETAKTIDIPITRELVGEDAESFTVALTRPVDDALLSDTTSQARVTIARSDARSDSDNRFAIGRPKRLANGSAQLPVTVPNPGTITTRDAGPNELLKVTTVEVARAGTIEVAIRPASKAKRKLRRGKKVRLAAEVVYAPYDGSANSTVVPVALRKRQ